jgi:hypothetical protein
MSVYAHSDTSIWPRPTLAEGQFPSEVRDLVTVRSNLYRIRRTCCRQLRGGSWATSAKELGSIATLQSISDSTEEVPHGQTDEATSGIELETIRCP